MKGKWITCAKSVETPLFRKTFTADNVARAVIDISGLGYFTLLVNGRHVTDELFTPALTNYAERDLSRFAYPIHDTISCRVLYMSYDVTPFMRKGENTVEVIVGNGWYRQKERVCEEKELYGESLIAAFDLTLTAPDGTQTLVSTDGSEEAFVYPILESNLFLGEVIDTRLFDEPLEKTPVLVSDFAPVRFQKQACPSDRVIRSLTPRLLGTAGGRLIYDAGENISGTIRLRVCGKRGDRLTVRYAESLNEDGTLCFTSTGANYVCSSGRPQIQTDTFILNGREQDITTMFVFHGFRYFDIEGDAALLEPMVDIIHTDLPVASSFSCDNALLNWLYDAYLRTQLDNVHGCVPSDCPHRERLGYTGDGQCCAETAMLTLDARGLYDKWIEDILDCQDTESGHIQHTAPFMGGGGGPGGWGCAVVIVPWQHYRRYGDREILRRTFPAMKKWLSYMIMHCEDGLMTHEEEGGWCLGDWAAPIKMVLPEPFVNTCYLVKTLDIMSRVAQTLVDLSWHDYEAIKGSYKKALYDRYFDGKSYCGGVQAADAFAIWAELPESEHLLDGLCARYDALGDFDTGFLGTDILCEVLMNGGRGDLALRLMASENAESGFNYMRSRGATTIYEYLNNDRASQNHPMFGACVRQLFTGLLGLHQRENTAGWTDVIVEPLLTSLVKSASGHIMTPRGAVRVSFDVHRHSLYIDIPDGLTAALRLNGKEQPLPAGQHTFEI